MLIFVHGMLSNADVWHSVVHYFNERGFLCKTVDLKKGLDLRKTCIQDYVNKVKAMVTEDDIVIGHSMGGLIVQKVAEEATIKGGVAICSAAPKGVKFRGAIVLASAKYAPKVIRGKPFKQDYRYVKKYMLVGVEEEDARNIYEKLEEESAIVTHELGRNKIAVDETKVNCPLLFIAAEKDKICAPELIKRIADKYNAEYRLYDCCHHFFCNNNWQDIAEEILDFINKL
jgi:pimeloyl-ACP methyl ester carboxylesterase